MDSSIVCVASILAGAACHAFAVVSAKREDGAHEALQLYKNPLWRVPKTVIEPHIPNNKRNRLREVERSWRLKPLEQSYGWR